jgi:ubiquitin-protein ligase
VFWFLLQLESVSLSATYLQVFCLLVKSTRRPLALVFATYTEPAELAMSLRRIAQEYESLQSDPPLGVGSAGPIEADDLLQWVGHITGPPGTPYEHRNFPLAIIFPEEYPVSPFHLAFTTDPPFHPNVSEEGEVWLAELDEIYWIPAFTVSKILVCLQALLSDPDLEDGVLNYEAATLYLTNREGFIEKASQ